MLDVNIMRETF